MRDLSTTKVYQLHAQTMDQLFAEAESLGKVSIEANSFRDVYDAQIVFSRKSGTRIYAKGSDQSAICALANAINEAREMGAGE